MDIQPLGRAYAPHGTSWLTLSDMTSMLEAPRPASRKRPVMAGARVTEAEYRQLQAAAERAGQTVSTYLRGLIIEATEQR